MTGNVLDVKNLKNILNEKDAMSEMISNWWTTWNADRQPFLNKVAEVEEYIYADSTRETSNGKNFNHSTHRPKLAQIYDNLTTNYEDGLFPQKRWLTVNSEIQEDFNNSNKRKKIVAYLTTKHRLSRQAEVWSELIDDYVLYGNAFAMVYYLAQKPNPNNKKSQSEYNYVGPQLRRINPENIVFNIYADSWDESPKILRSLKTFGDLVQEAEDYPEDGWKADIIEKLKDQRQYLGSIQSSSVDRYSTTKIQGFGSFHSYITSGTCEILEFFGSLYDTSSGEFYKDYVITVVDRKYVVRARPLETWRGKPRLHHVGWRKRKGNIWAMGPLENLVGLQYRINHLENARADAMDQMIYGDEIYKGDVEVELNPDGSKTYQVSQDGSVGRLAPDTTILTAQLDIDKLEFAMEVYAGSPREQSGFRTPGEKTKFEVSALLTASNRLYRNKLNKFEVSLVEPVLNDELEVSAMYGPVFDRVRYDDTPEGIPEFLSLKKEDLMLNGRVVPMASRNASRKAQIASDLSAFQRDVLTADKELQNHFPTLKLANVWEDILDISEYNLVESYGRIPERLEAARQAQIAQTIANEENLIDDEPVGKGGFV